MPKKKYDVFLSGNLVNLVILNENIAKDSDWYNWFNDKKNVKYLQVGKFPNTKEKQLEYFRSEILEKKKIIKNNYNHNKKIQLGIINKKNNKLIGMIALLDFDFFNRSCGISSVINLQIKISNRLKILKEAQDLMINHAFFSLNLRRICTVTFSNELKQLAQKMFGFKLEGVLRESQYLEGKYVDSYVLSILKKEWKND